MDFSLSSKLESILFFRGESTSIVKLVEYTEASEDEIRNALSDLRDQLSGRGLVLVEHDNEFMLGTSPEASAIIENITKEELTRDLGKAGLETLAIILYKGSASKREIDYIRGVNSGFILRNLLIRGLVIREEQKGERGYVYTGTIELLTYMGVTKAEDMPEYSEMQKELKDFLTAPAEEESVTVHSDA